MAFLGLNGMKSEQTSYSVSPPQHLTAKLKPMDKSNDVHSSKLCFVIDESSEMTILQKGYAFWGDAREVYGFMHSTFEAPPAWRIKLGGQWAAPFLASPSQLSQNSNEDARLSSPRRFAFGVAIGRR
jgi:hypothetical protein